MSRSKSLLWLCPLLLPAFLFLFLNPTAGEAANTVAGSRHDFRSPGNDGPNRRCGALAALAGKSPCAACHTAHNATGDSLQRADFGLRLGHPMREASLKCLACHDPHNPGKDGRFLRGGSRSLLCAQCHAGEFGMALGFMGMGMGPAGIGMWGQ
ncbi:MAG: cytochrome c3 family protein [Methanocella sp.]